MDSPGTTTKSSSNEFQATWTCVYEPILFIWIFIYYSHWLHRALSEFELERIAHDLEEQTTISSFQRLLRHFLSLVDHTTTKTTTSTSEEDGAALKPYIDAVIPLANQLRPNIAHL